MLRFIFVGLIDPLPWTSNWWIVCNPRGENEWEKHFQNQNKLEISVVLYISPAFSAAIFNCHFQNDQNSSSCGK